MTAVFMLVDAEGGRGAETRRIHPVDMQNTNYSLAVILEAP